MAWLGKETGWPGKGDGVAVGHPGVPLAPRHWQDLGYLIIYVTGRPDMQKQRVVAWLAQHNFPHGVVSFCDGLVHDPLRHKANFLKLLISEVGGSGRGPAGGRGGAGGGACAHAALAHSCTCACTRPTAPPRTWRSTAPSACPPCRSTSWADPPRSCSSSARWVGRSRWAAQAGSRESRPCDTCDSGAPPPPPLQFITDGYAAHLAQLKFNHRARPARNTGTRMALRKGSFGLPGQGDFLRSRNHLLRTISAQPSGPGLRHERTHSQPDGEQRGQRSMSVAAGCWGRTMAGRLEPGAAAGPK